MAKTKLSKIYPIILEIEDKEPIYDFLGQQVFEGDQVVYALASRGDTILRGEVVKKTFETFDHNKSGVILRKKLHIRMKSKQTKSLLSVKGQFGNFIKINTLLENVVDNQPES